MSAPGFHYTTSVTGGSASESDVVTDEDGMARVSLSIAEPNAVITVTEARGTSYELDNIECWDDTTGEDLSGDRHEWTISFTVVPAHWYECIFQNASLLPDPALVDISAKVDRDGNPETSEDVEEDSGRTFVATTAGNTTIREDSVTTDEFGDASFQLTFPEEDDAGTVTIVEQARDDSHFIGGYCDDESDEVETQLAWTDGEITLDVIPGSRYYCEVTNSAADAPVITPTPSVGPTASIRPTSSARSTPLLTPPETDSLRPSVARSSVGWFPLLLAVLTGCIATSVALARRRR
jgi:hypothetical protein